jgi:tetratricopeptide (TPR) repeat protein
VNVQERIMPASAANPVLAPKGPAEIFRSPAKLTLVLCLLLAAITLALYNPAAGHGFANYDDDRYVVTNAHVRAGLTWSTTKWAFTSFDEANWHPLTWLSHALDCQLFQLNPAGHHYTSLLLHAVCVLLVFLLLAKATRSIGRSLMVAALFAVHPLNVESVAWIAERKSVLAMLFFLLTLCAYGWYGRKPSVGRYTVVALSFAMALMSKPMAITLPFALLLLDYWPLRRVAGSEHDDLQLNASSHYSRLPIWRLCLEKVPLLAMSLGSAIVTVAAQRSGGAITHNLVNAPGLRLENAIVSYALYIAKAVWPSRLAILYPYPHSLPLLKVLLSALFLITVSALVVKYRERRYLPVGWFWYLGTMVPMIGLMQVGNQAMADRYAYLPLLGIFVMAVWGVADLVAPKAASEPASVPPEHRASQAFLAVVGVCIVVAMAAVTHVQISYWSDDLTLWTHTLSVTPPNFVAENNVGAILAQQGRIEEAVAHLRIASALEPDDPVSQLNLGVYAQQHGDIQQAISRYGAALQFATDSRIRASAYANLGQIYLSQHDYARARENFESAAKLNNPYPLQLGLLAQKTGDWNLAAQYYAYALAAQPSDVGFLLLEQALRGAGNEQDAQRAHQQAEQHSSDLGRAQQIADQLLSQ